METSVEIEIGVLPYWQEAGYLIYLDQYFSFFGA